MRRWLLLVPVRVYPALMQEAASHIAEGPTRSTSNRLSMMFALQYLATIGHPEAIESLVRLSKAADPAIAEGAVFHLHAANRDINGNRREPLQHSMDRQLELAELIFKGSGGALEEALRGPYPGLPTLLRNYLDQRMEGMKRKHVGSRKYLPVFRDSQSQ